MRGPDRHLSCQSAKFSNAISGANQAHATAVRHSPCRMIKHDRVSSTQRRQKRYFWELGFMDCSAQICVRMVQM
jgi:hypothetical protein